MAKSNVRRATPKPMKGYMLTDDQQKTIGNVAKLLIQAQCYLENENVDNSMECYGDFLVLYRNLTRTLNKAYDIMHVHNVASEAYHLADGLEATNLHGGYTHL